MSTRTVRKRHVVALTPFVTGFLVGALADSLRSLLIAIAIYLAALAVDVWRETP